MRLDRYHWHRRAQDAIAQSYLTNSKRPESFVKGVFPTHIAKGHGCHLWDHDGKRYLDFICGLGTNLLGYGNERVNAAISAELRNGYSHSLATHHEVEAAEKVKELFPFVDAVKFLKSGSDACSAAIRIARAATDRDVVLSDGYHGWHDTFAALAPPAIGVPSFYRALDYTPIHNIGFSWFKNDFSCWDKVAAVIIEPVITDHSRERIEYLKQLRADCTKHGVLLIFDEIITGFRFPKFSVASWCGVTPDLIVIGKALANGMPLAAVGGKYAVMNAAEYFISTTYAGETLSLVAAKATMTLLQTKYSIEDLWKHGQAFQDEFNGMWPGHLAIEGYPTRGILKGEPLTKALFQQECCKAGILIGASPFFNFPLANEWKDAMHAMKGAVMRIRNGEVKLEGEMPARPFAQKVREASA